MSKLQYLVLSCAVVLFAGLYFGFDTRPKHKPAEEGAPMMPVAGSGVSFDRLMAEGKKALSPEQAAKLSEMEQQAANAKDPKADAEARKSLSGYWYQIGNLPLAGGYAEQVAELEKTDEAWSVAGGTFFNALQASRDADVRHFCADHAAEAFQKAAAINPDQVEHRVNLALVYAEDPKPDNPMQAVLLLRELEQKYPQAPAVYNALGRLAIKTNQWERAIERLEKAYSLDPKNPNTPCLLAKAYEGAGNVAKAAEYKQKCQ